MLIVSVSKTTVRAMTNRKTGNILKVYVALNTVFPSELMCLFDFALI